ncbi:MAG: DUF1761 domain-containing protein [Chitinophagaceae bacterium]
MDGSISSSYQLFRTRCFVVFFFIPKKWIEYTGVNVNDENAKKGMAAIMFGSFMMMLITAIGIAILAEYLVLDTWQYGVKLGVLTGVGFAFTSMAINMLYEKKPAGLYFINGGYQIVGNIIAAVIICAWR